MASEPVIDGYWWIYRAHQASRRDGLSVCRGEGGLGLRERTADEPMAWICSFPPERGGLSPVVELADHDVLRKAIAEVDARFPMAPWWAEVQTR